MLGLCWKWWLRLIDRGKNPAKFVSVLASFAARAVRSGRRVCGQERAKDALSTVAQQRHSFTVSSLPQISTLNPNPLSDALIDNTCLADTGPGAVSLRFPKLATQPQPP